MTSLGSIFAQWFRPPNGRSDDATVRSSGSDPRRDPTYAAADSALPAVATEEVIVAHADLLKRLRDAYGADEGTFERDILSVVERYARFVHLLPATADSYFQGAGGLFRMGLEVGFYALQATDGVIFCGRQTITQRSALEPRWRYATFLAGVCSELHRPLTQLVVTDDRGNPWPAYVSPLSPWLQEERAKRYYVRWRPQPPEARALAIAAMARVVTPKTVQYLAENNAIVVPSLVAAVSATVSREANMLAELVRRASALVIERELRANGDHSVRPKVRSHLERDLVDAMRRLVADRKWVANSPASCLWYAEDGMFLLWPQAAAEMAASLEHDGLPDVPKAHQTIAELLAAVGVLEARSDGSLFWDIYVPDAPKSSSAVKLASPAVLASAGSVAPAPLRRALRERASVETAVPSTPQGELALSQPEREPIERVAEAPAPESQVPQRAPVGLSAPPRLNPAVRDALQQIIATIDSPAQSLAAFVIELGVFIPLKEFERRSVDPALAVRALSEAAMLASDPKHPGSKTHSRSFHDEPVLGLVVDFRHVSGLQVGAYAQARRELDATEP